jgi:hypothetical protein
MNCKRIIVCILAIWLTILWSNAASYYIWILPLQEINRKAAMNKPTRGSAPLPVTAQRSAPQRFAPKFRNGSKVRCVIKFFPQQWGTGTVVLVEEAEQGGLGYWIKFDNHPHLQFLLEDHIQHLCVRRPAVASPRDLRPRQGSGHTQKLGHHKAKYSKNPKIRENRRREAESVNRNSSKKGNI